MVVQDPQTDAYLAAAPAFARPILERVRAQVHAACPGVREGRKWHLVSFEGKGIICMMAAFKRHCALVFWKSKLVLTNEEIRRLKRLSSLAGLPSKAVLGRWLTTAWRLDQDGVPTPHRGAKRRSPVAGLAVPDDLQQGLAEHPVARAAFTAFSPAARRDYISWLVEAKRPETRRQRLATALGWIAEGKRRNWK